MLYGLSTRHYKHGLEPMDSQLESTGISKSSISRHFIECTRRALAELLARRLDQARFSGPDDRRSSGGTAYGGGCSWD